MAADDTLPVPIATRRHGSATELLDQLTSGLREIHGGNPPPDVYRDLLVLRSAIQRIEDQNARFLEDHEIIDIAKKEGKQAAIDLLESIGFSMDRDGIKKTREQVSFFLSLKHGFKGALYAIGALASAILSGIAVTYFNGWVKK